MKVPIDDDVIAEVTLWIKGVGYRHVRLYEYPNEDEGPYLLEQGRTNNYDQEWSQDETDAKASVVDLARQELDRFDVELTS